MVLNEVYLWGRLTTDPELRQTPTGKLSVKVSIAVSQRKFSKDSEAKTDFIYIQAWNKQAEFLSKYFSKGSAVFVRGTLRNNNYVDKNGVKRYEIIVLVEDLQFGENKPAVNSPAARGESVQPVNSGENSYQPYDTGDFEEIIGDSVDLPY